MSVKIMTLVWERAPYTAGSLLVLLALADWANDEGVAWPSMERLAQKARIDRRSAQRIVRQLEKDGILFVEHGGGRNKQHKYTLLMETVTKCRPLVKLGIGDISDTETATLDPERATFDTETATPTSPDPSEDTSVDPPKEPSEAHAPSQKRIQAMSEDEFLSRLENDPAFAGIDVRRLNNKMILWCEVNGKRPTRRRLVNWLNREDKPIQNGNGNGTNRSASYQTAPERRDAELHRRLGKVTELQGRGKPSTN